MPGGGDGDGSPSSPTSQQHPEEDEADCWELKDDLVIRHHFTPRKQFFNPKDAELSLPIDLNRLSSTRWTFMEYLDKEEKDTEIDEWKEKPSTAGRDRVWVGTTEFRVIPIDEELKTQRMSWEDGPKKVMNRGQRKKIHAEVQDIEKEDYALWSAPSYATWMESSFGVVRWCSGFDRDLSGSGLRVLPTFGHQIWMERLRQRAEEAG